jgi:hypothetical protein
MGGSKTAILAQVVHFYSDAVGHITTGANNKYQDPDQDETGYDGSHRVRNVPPFWPWPRIERGDRHARDKSGD